MSLKYEPSSEPLHISILPSKPYTRRFSLLEQHSEVFEKLVEAIGKDASPAVCFIDNLLVRIHFIVVMIRWTGLAPWEFEFPFPGSLTPSGMLHPNLLYSKVPTGLTERTHTSRTKLQICTESVIPHAECLSCDQGACS